MEQVWNKLLTCNLYLVGLSGLVQCFSNKTGTDTMYNSIVTALPKSSDYKERQVQSKKRKVLA